MMYGRNNCVFLAMHLASILVSNHWCEDEGTGRRDFCVPGSWATHVMYSGLNDSERLGMISAMEWPDVPYRVRF